MEKGEKNKKGKGLSKDNDSWTGPNTSDIWLPGFQQFEQKL